MLIDKFGIAAIRSAWYNSKEVDGHILDGYTKVIYAISIVFLVSAFFFL